jgi:hypothetical protein
MLVGYPANLDKVLMALIPELVTPCPVAVKKFYRLSNILAATITSR